MSDPTFALGTFASSKGRVCWSVMRNDVVGLSEGHKPFATSSHARRGMLRELISVLGLLIVKSRQTGQGRLHFRRSEWEDLPTLYHIVNALADIELI